MVARTNERAVETEAPVERSERLPWTAPDIQTLDMSDTAAATPRTPGTDGSFTLS
jgi:hypothetical protein